MSYSGSRFVLVCRSVIFFAVFHACLASQAREVNTDETKVPTYTLPDPLKTINGEQVNSAKTWTDTRRGEILELFRRHVYGCAPARPATMRFRVTATAKDALNGLATRKTISVRFEQPAKSPAMEIVLYLPNKAKGPVPVFVGIHLFDKRAGRPVPGVPLVLDKNAKTRPNFPANRLVGAKLPEVILKRGYGFATIDAADLAPDSTERYANGVIGHYQKPGQTKRDPDDWGAIGAWAWGLSRAVDYFETDEDVDAHRVIVIGHSRMGKTALWAGAQDERFAMVISNESGCGGAALSRRRFGETVAIINKAFPYWFCENFKRYDENEGALPVDQHMLISLIAPRPVYVASAEKDRWADPRGEFLAALGAEPVYRLFGKVGLGTREFPPINRPVGETIGYHVRSGRHDLTDYDWSYYLDFADKHLRNRTKRAK